MPFGVSTPEELQDRIGKMLVSFNYLMMYSNLFFACCVQYSPFQSMNRALASISVQKNLANEAQSCISDCADSLKTEHYEEELESAKFAVEAAGVAYSELLEELAVIDGGVEVLNEVRKIHSPAVESLRQELKKVEKMGEGN